MSKYDAKQGVQGIATLTNNALATYSVVGEKKQTSTTKAKK